MVIEVPTGRTALGVGVGVGVGGLLAYWAWQRVAAKRLPTEWEEVGEVTKLNVFPLKSGRPLCPSEAEATEEGMRHSHLRDRSFMVRKKGGPFLTGRQAPKLTTVSLSFENDLVTFSAQDGSTVSIHLQEVKKASDIIDIVCFGADVKGLDCGDKVAQWMSKVLFDGETEVRLLYNGELTERAARRAPYFNFKLIRNSDKVVYADTCAYMLATESSLEDLNSRLAEPVTMDWFRANVIVGGSKAYDEDDWAFVKIGDVVLRRLKPCDRCIFTIVDPAKGCKNPDQEPLATLKKYRLVDGPESLAKAWAAKPVFGSHMGIDVCGKVKVGDKVLVARASKNPQWNY